MRPRGQTPRMPVAAPDTQALIDGSYLTRFNEAAGADPADAADGCGACRMTISCCFNEAAGADPADAPANVRERS